MAKIKKQVTIDEDLLRRAEDFADDNYLSVSALMCIALNQYLNGQEVANCMKSLSVAMQKIADEGQITEDAQRDLDDITRLAQALGLKNK